MIALTLTQSQLKKLLLTPIEYNDAKLLFDNLYSTNQERKAEEIEGACTMTQTDRVLAESSGSHLLLHYVTMHD